MKKFMIFAAMAVCALFAGAQTEVLQIELNDGTVQKIAVDKIKEMTFGELSAAESIAGTYNGTVSLTIGGQFTYSTGIAVVITANADGTINFSYPEYSLKGTMMGDLTLGAYTVSNIAYDEAKGGFYRDYSDDGIKQHFTSTSGMNNDYVLGKTSTLLITAEGSSITVANPFKLGNMPLPIVANFTGSK